jgi:glyoxylase-like metal-dependent hydrolase (beta-lactamase superfamily II)
MSSPEIRPIDVRHLGRRRVICAWLVGDVLIDPGPASSVESLLEGLAGFEPRVIALTHIHLDHAGATGTLAERWPDVEVAVHERGAGHMIEPSRLLESATRLYGADMDRLWGEVLPVPQERVTVLRGGERIGELDVAYTPGHASHHVSFWHAGSRTAFVGDVAGVRIEPFDYVLVPALPPEVDIELWHESIALVRDWQPERFALTHFGVGADPLAHLERFDVQLDRWAARARETDREQFTRELRADIEANCDQQAALCYQQGAPFDFIHDGLARYWSKHEAAAPGAA